MTPDDATTPEARLPPTARPVIIDALNVAYWCGSPPSLRLPLALLVPLIARGQPVQLYFDASAPYRLAGEAGLYAQLRRYPGHCIEVPSGRPADRVLLRQARITEGCILSRDRYRDHRRRFRRLIDDPTRLLAGGVAEGRLRVPALALDVALPASAGEAWQLLEPLLADARDDRAD